MRAKLSTAVEWIAYNDDGNELDLEVVADSLTVCLVADIFGKEREEVARRVIKERISCVNSRHVR